MIGAGVVKCLRSQIRVFREIQTSWSFSAPGGFLREDRVGSSFIPSHSMKCARKDFTSQQGRSSTAALRLTAGIKAALRDLVRRSWFWLRPEENDDVDQGHTRSRIGNCCGKRPTGICWKLACAVQPEPGLQPLSWGEHVLAARPLSRLQRSRLEALVAIFRAVSVPSRRRAVSEAQISAFSVARWWAGRPPGIERRCLPGARSSLAMG